LLRVAVDTGSSVPSVMTSILSSRDRLDCISVHPSKVLGMAGLRLVKLMGIGY